MRAHKTQLIRAAPHHVRPDFTAIEDTAVENLKDATATFLFNSSQLKSRGVTRFADLNRANKQDLLDVEEHEEEMTKALKRRRLAETLENDDLAEASGTPSFPAPADEPPEMASTGPAIAAPPVAPELPPVPELSELDDMSDQPEPSGTMNHQQRLRLQCIWTQ